jgi:tetratricopeptide (TPR) repeat protein
MLLWMAGSLALNVTAILMTGTRSALVALLVLLPLLGFILIRYRALWTINQWTRARRWSVGLILVLGVTGLGVIPTGHPDIAAGTTPLGFGITRTASMTKNSEYTEGSFSIRSVMWKATARMMLATPLAGVGAGAWEVQIPLYQRIGESLETDYYAHNEYLQLLGEYGLIVGGLFLAFLFSYLLLASSTTWNLRGAELAEAPLRALTLASLLSMLIVSNAGFPWHLASCGALLALNLALLSNSDVRMGKQEPLFTSNMRWGPVFNRIAIATVASCTLLATYITQRAALVEWRLTRAAQTATSVLESTAADTPLTLAARRSQVIQDVGEGIAINPHYRKLTAEVAELLEAQGDWPNTVWLLHSIAASRPNIPAIWYGLAKGHSLLGQHDQADLALKQVQRLQPTALSTQALEVLLLSRKGYGLQAAGLLIRDYQQGHYDYNMVQTGYLVGLETENWPLAIQSLELRNTAWPQQAADGNFRLGLIYALPGVHDKTKAIAAFAAALLAAPEWQKEDYRRQTPLEFQVQGK